MLAEVTSALTDTGVEICSCVVSNGGSYSFKVNVHLMLI